LSIYEVNKYNKYFKYENDSAIMDGWWLRSPGYYSNEAACVYGNGVVNDDGNYVFRDVGVRPALWLNL
jgi:hypothetical protein